MEESIITSTQNAKVKHVVALQQKSALRRKEGLFVVEGRRELMHCLEAGYEIAECFVLDKLADLADLADLAPLGSLESLGSLVSLVSPQVYEKMAYRGSTEGVIAVVRERQRSLDDLQLSASPLIIVLERVEKPGNLGAVLRSADAAKADAVIICDPLTDLYNPNLIRSSIGAIFSVPCVACSSEDCIAFLYYDTDMLRGTAIVMGTESTGLTEVWRQAADAHIRIPMLGQLDSLNVSVSAAILLFEAVRQRNSKK